MQVVVSCLCAAGLFIVGLSGCSSALHKQSGQPMGAIAPSVQADEEDFQNGSLANQEWKYYGPYIITQGKLLVDISGSGKIYFVVGPNSRSAPDIGVDNPVCLFAEGGVSGHCEITTEGAYYIGVQGLGVENTYVLDIKTVPGGELDSTEQGALTRDEAKSFGPYVLDTGKLTITLDISGDINFSAGAGMPQNAVETVITNPICEQNDSIENKLCTITIPGTYYVVLRGAVANSSYSLRVKKDATGQGTLESVTDSGALDGGRWKYYGPYQLVSGSLNVETTITGDISLYVGPNAGDKNNVLIKEPFCVDNVIAPKKACSIGTPGTYYIGLLGVNPNSNYTLTVNYPSNNP